MKGRPLSVRGIQKRIEHYARKSGLNVSCHRLRHTVTTQLLNADADLATIQNLLGHSQITTTQRYCLVAICQKIDFTGDREAKCLKHLFDQEDFGPKGAASFGPFRVIEMSPEGQKEVLIKESKKTH